MNAFADAAAVLAADPNLGAAATLHRAGALWSPLALRVVLSWPARDAIGPGLLKAAATSAAEADITVAALPAGLCLARGDRLEVAGHGCFGIETADLDESRVTWRAKLSRAEA